MPVSFDILQQRPKRPMSNAFINRPSGLPALKSSDYSDTPSRPQAAAWANADGPLIASKATIGTVKRTFMWPLLVEFDTWHVKSRPFSDTRIYSVSVLLRCSYSSLLISTLA